MPIQTNKERTIAHRADAMKQWLEKIHARPLWETKVGHGRGVFACYMANGYVFIIQIFPDGGWELFTTGGSGKIDETLADAEKRLGIAPQ